jgi:hypothetical protein
MPENETYDEEREDYASLADEASCEDAHPWNEDNWDPRAVANAKKYAAKYGLNWPPHLGDFDRWYDLDTNGELKEL